MPRFDQMNRLHTVCGFSDNFNVLESAEYGRQKRTGRPLIIGNNDPEFLGGSRHDDFAEATAGGGPPALSPGCSATRISTVVPIPGVLLMVMAPGPLP